VTNTFPLPLAALNEWTCFRMEANDSRNNSQVWQNTVPAFSEYLAFLFGTPRRRHVCPFIVTIIHTKPRFRTSHLEHPTGTTLQTKAHSKQTLFAQIIPHLPRHDRAKAVLHLHYVLFRGLLRLAIRVELRV